MKQLIFVMLLPILAGCLSVTPSVTSDWPVDYKSGDSVWSTETPVFGVTRVVQVLVRAPFGEREIAVRKADGTLAFDPYNQFAAVPAMLLKGVVFDALEASGLCQSVVGSSSSVVASSSVEVTFTRLCLDCRNEGERRAVVAVTVRILEKGTIVSLAKGAGVADAADGNYGAAFSSAVSDALIDALKSIRR